MQPRVIRYQFVPDEGPTRSFTVRLDPDTLANLDPLPDPAPDWTRLEFQKCPNCPLDNTPLCPAAARLAGVVADFAKTRSFEEAFIQADFPERTVSKRTAVQVGLSSLVGIYLATSGCPILAKLRPLVRTHLPFATEEETLYRTVSTYLLGQYFRAVDGSKPDWSLEGLAAIYREVGAVNRAFATRLRVAAPADANLNALVLLDTFAKAVPDALDDRLAELRSFFASWGERPRRTAPARPVGPH